MKHDVTYYDPLEVFGEGGNLAKSGAEVQNPHFFLKEGQDKEMDAMRAVIKAADCYIVCSAEYVWGVLCMYIFISAVLRLFSPPGSRCTSL